jgi:glycosyltransferase involved in cell wall biosynthesis
MKVAIVHYWLVNMRGGEKVVEALGELFPHADIYTHVYDPSAVSEALKRHTIKTTFIQKLPFATRRYQSYLPLMPLALEQLDLRGYDLVISSESGPAKGIIIAPETLHVCYCHTPMRYVWDMYHDYLAGTGPLARFIIRPLIHYLRLWDLTTAARVDHFITNSAYVARRVRKHYRREAEVIHPPVDTEAFAPAAECGDFYLMVGQLVRYKRADIAVEAFRRMNKRLVVIGDGEQLPALERTAAPSVTLLGRQPFSVIRDHYARCKALIFPGEEDFGIVPVEAMASGRPVIAYRRGGAMETVVEGVTGLFFDQQTPESLIEAVERYEATECSFSSAAIVQHARGFAKDRFEARMREAIGRWLRDASGHAQKQGLLRAI